MKISLRKIKKITASVALLSLFWNINYPIFQVYASEELAGEPVVEEMIAEEEIEQPEEESEPSPTPDSTPEPEVTPEPTPTPDATPELTPTPDATPTPTLDPTATPEPTATPTPTADSTPTPTPGVVETVFSNPEKVFFDNTAVQLGVWRENADGSMTVLVETGGEYEFKNSGLKIKFTRIDSGTGEITVKEITLSDEQVAQLGALSNKAWDITSKMADGTFEYALTFPAVENVDQEKIEVVYVEEQADLDDQEKIKTVEDEDVSVDEEKKEITIEANHFTVFVAVATYLDLALTVSSDIFAIGASVYTEATGLNNSAGSYYKISILNPLNTLVGSSSCVNLVSSAEYNYLIGSGSLAGADWKVVVDEYVDSSCSTLTSPRNFDEKEFTVIDKALEPITVESKCMEDMYGKNLVCTANDAPLVNVDSWKIVGDGCQSPDDEVTFEATWKLQSNANERYNVGLYFPIEGQGSALNGQCSVSSLPNYPAPWHNFDNNICGDMASASVLYPKITLTVDCLDTDGDNNLNLPYCVSWEQNSSSCNSPLDTVPGSPSKCGCDDGFEIPIVVPYAAEIEVVKDLNPSSDLGLFNLQIDGATKKADAGDAGTTGVVVVGAGTSTVSGATHTVGEIAGTGTDLANYSSSISCVDRGLTTFNGGLPLVLSGAGPLTVSVDKDDDVVCTITNTRKAFCGDGNVDDNEQCDDGNTDDSDLCSNSCTFTKGHLIVQKTTEPAGDQTVFNITASGTGVITGSPSGIITDFVDKDYEVTPGTYSVAETVPVGWAKTGDTCQDVVVGAGETKNCLITNSKLPTLKVIKNVINDNGGTKTVADFGITFSGGSLNFGAGVGSGDTKTYTSQTLTLNAGNYTLSESDVPGYAEGTWNCGTVGASGLSTEIALVAGQNVTCEITNNDQSATLIVEKVLTTDDGSLLSCSDFSFKVNGGLAVPFDSSCSNQIEVSAGTYDVVEVAKDGFTTTYENCSNVVIPNGGSATCKIFNNDDPGKLIVKKVVVNDNGGAKKAEDFSFAVNSASAVAFEADGQNELTVDAGTYDIVEPAVTGYTTTYENCAGVKIANGETETCTITNNDQPGTLIVKKNLINDDGGNETCEDFSFSYLPASAVAFESDCENSIVVNSGTYTVTESAKTGYEPSYDNCEGIFVPNGGSATCTITNNDVAPSLTLTKKVINDNGGTAEVNDFGLTIGGTGVDSGQVYPVKANTAYAINEAGLFGYAFKSITGDAKCPSVLGGSVSLNEGENITCEIVNDDVAPKLTVYKIVDNGDGGTLLPSDFVISVAGVDVSPANFPGNSSGTPVALNAGDYKVTETNLPGYEAKYSADCEGKILVGETKTCTITNDDQAPTLTLVKTVVNNNGGDKEVRDFALFISGDPVTSGVPVTLKSNTQYTASEIQLPGYSASAWGTDCLANGTITLKPGENKTCTITNDDIAPKLTLVKHVMKDDGGSAVVADFPLFIDGNLVVSGTAHEVSANTVHTATETTLPGYEPSAWSNACAADGTITLLPGENKTCEITNNDVQAKLTVTKIVNNGPYGKKVVADFPLYVGTTSVISGVQNGFNAGDYLITENNQAGYSSSITGDCDAEGNISLAVGDVKACTITNTDTLGKIIIEKQTLPDGDNTYFDFTGDLSGSIKDGEKLEKIVVPGTYAVSESAKAGWDLTDLTCTEDGTENSGESAAAGNTANIKVEANETVTCTFTNTKRSSITIVKDAVNNNAQDFEFTNNFGNDNPEVFSLDDDSNATLSNTRTFEVLPGTYAISEKAVAGWQQESAICTNGETIDSIDVAPGESVTCTFVNEQYAKIVLVKNAIGGNGEFEFDATGAGLPAEIELETVAGTASQTFADLDQDNEYSIKEDVPAGWKLTSATCSNGDPVDKITPNAGEEITCTFTNTKDATLTLVKTVENNNGGTAVADDFQGKIDGTNVPWGVAQVVSATSHVASETTLPGYEPSAWGGACATDGTVALKEGENKTCTITNDDQQAYIIIDKTVVNDDGGTAKPDDFKLKVDGQAVLDEVKFPVVPGAHTAREEALPGYAVGTWGGDCNEDGIVNVALGQTKTCTITNDDIAPKLTLIKEVVNNNGGNALASEWTLSATGERGFSGEGTQDGAINKAVLGPNDVKAGVTYLLSESGPVGYTDNWWKCEGGEASGNTILLGVGAIATCTIVNDDVAPTLTVVKKVINDDGGNETVGAFEIKLNDASLGFGAGDVSGDMTTYQVSPEVRANEQYTLSEKDLAGYAEGTWSCKEVTGAPVSHPVTLNEGQNVICEITNDDIVPRITLNKVVVGGDANVDDFGISVDGESVLSGSTTAVQANDSIAINEVGKEDYSFTSITGDDKCPDALGGTVVLDEGENITCTITNTRDTGSVTINKVIDVDGNLDTIDDQTAGANWEFSILSTDDDTSDLSSGLTDMAGVLSFNPLKTGRYNITETVQPGYDLIGADCGIENGSLNGNTLYSTEVVKNSTTICTFYNTPNGTIHGFKWRDLNGNGERDCVEGENDSESRQICEFEPLLSGWKINLYQSNGEGGYGSEPIASMLTDEGNEHFGWYWFEHLLPGQYKVCEVLQAGWRPVYPSTDKDDNCHLVTLPDDNSNDFRESLNAVEGPEYNFGNQFVESELYVSKTNNEYANGPEKPGDLVTYTIVVEAKKNGVKKATVVDLPPRTFKYVPGSWTANSSLRGDLSGLGLGLTKVYASPGQWTLGDLEDGEKVTLTYQARIEPGTINGVYPDLTSARGQNLIGEDLLAFATDSDFPKVDDNFAGTRIAVETVSGPPVVKVRADKDEVIEEVEVKVKGITYLPATGADGRWIWLAILGIFLGLGMLAVGYWLKSNRRFKMDKIGGVFFGIVLAGLSFQNVQAAGLSVRLFEPKVTSLEAFDLDFVTLDILDREVSVECFKKGPSDGGFSQFVSTITLEKNGNSGICPVGSAVLSETGDYEFKVIAKAGGDQKESGVVKTFFDGTAPSTPKYIEKDEETSCRNEVTFQTANDGQTAYVEVYRSQHSRDIVIDSNSRIQTINVGPNQKYSFDDQLSATGCGDNYYYAIRAFDSVGNFSGVRAEEFEVTVEEEKEVLVTEERTVEGGGTSLAGGAESTEQTEGASSESGTGESQENPSIDEGAQAEEGTEALGEQTEKSFFSRLLRSDLFWLMLLVLGGAGWWYYKKRKKEEPGEMV